VHTKVVEALEILSALGIPMNGLTQRRKEKMAKAFMAVADVKPSTPWSAAKDNHAQHQLQSRQIITFLNTYWEETISPGSYDDMRRKDLALPVAGHIVLKSAKNPDANTNDGTRGFAIDPAAGAVIRTFRTRRWPTTLKTFNLNRPTLAAHLKRDRDLARIPVQLNSQTRFAFSPGKHSELQNRSSRCFFQSSVLEHRFCMWVTRPKKTSSWTPQGARSCTFLSLLTTHCPMSSPTAKRGTGCISSKP